jgi:hypothetical protein
VLKSSRPWVQVWTGQPSELQGQWNASLTVMLLGKVHPDMRIDVGRITDMCDSDVSCFLGVMFSHMLHCAGRRCLCHASCALLTSHMGSEPTVGSMCRPSAASVQDFVKTVKTHHGNPRWASPSTPSPPTFNGTRIPYSWQGTYGKDRRKWGLRDDMATFHTCADTWWNASYLIGSVVASLLRACHVLGLKIMSACCHLTQKAHPGTTVILRRLSRWSARACYGKQW